MTDQKNYERRERDHRDRDRDRDRDYRDRDRDRQRQRQRDKERSHRRRSRSNQRDRSRDKRNKDRDRDRDRHRSGKLSRSRSNQREKRERDHKQKESNRYSRTGRSKLQEHQLEREKDRQDEKGDAISSRSSSLGLTSNQLTSLAKNREIKDSLNQKRDQIKQIGSHASLRHSNWCVVDKFEQQRRASRLQQPILVRELFIGGVKEMNRQKLNKVMQNFGEIENIDINNNFMFVKYFKVMDASHACSNYQKINASLHDSHNNPNFKMFFSDYLKRYQVVGDHPRYENKDLLLPVLFVSFRGDSQLSQAQLRKIFGKYGYIRNMDVKKPKDNPSLKIVTLVEFQQLDQAIMARDRLIANKKKLKDNNCEISVMLNTQKAPSYQLRYLKSSTMRKQAPTPPPAPVIHYPMPMPAYPIGPTGMPIIPGVSGIPMPISMTMPPPIPGMTGMYQSAWPSDQHMKSMMKMMQSKSHQRALPPPIPPDKKPFWYGRVQKNNKSFNMKLTVIQGEQPQLPDLLKITKRAELSRYKQKSKSALGIMIGEYDPMQQAVFMQLSQYFSKMNRAGVVELGNSQLWISFDWQNIEVIYLHGQT